MRSAQILTAIAASSTLVSAWSWSENSIAARAADLLLPHKRAPQAVTLGAGSATPNPSQVLTSPTATASSASSAATTTGDSSATNSGSASSNTASSGNTASTPTQTTFDPRLPPGGVSMISPNTASSTQYYKVGDYVTFAWNYTSLSITPTAVDIIATCTANQATYAIALNQTVSGPTGAVTWDTSQYQTTPLLTNKYTLIIHDAQKPVTAAASAGYLAAFNQFTFGMYTPQPYTPLESFVCVTCNGALGAIERQSLVFVGIMSTAAVVGATWFSSGLGVF